MTDRGPGQAPRRNEPQADPPVASLERTLDEWFSRLLRLLGTIVAIGLWLLAAEALFLACAY